MGKYLLIVISVLLFLPNLFDIDLFPKPQYNHEEQFDPGLSGINSMDKLEEAVDSIADANAFVPRSIGYVETIADVIRNRFYHGYSHLSLSEDWLAAFAGKTIKYDLACKVNPEGILKHPYAACSQQVVVMMAFLRKQEISYRAVLFPHHYALEVLIDGQWYYFDPNREPKIKGSERLESSWHYSADTLKKYYDTIIFKDLDYALGTNVPLRYGLVNQVPASRQLFFETITGALSKILWCFPLLFIFFHPKDILFLRRGKKPGGKQ